jgi:hypothetical protein
MLKSHGIERSHRGVQVMLSNRAYVGEVRFGELVNLHAHKAIIEPELWGRVQRMIVSRGRRSSSERLLARLGVLRCGWCGARLSAMTLPKQIDPETGKPGYPIYRCPSTSDCPRHVTVSATIAEDVVVDAVKARIRGLEGRASAAENAREAHEELERAQAEYDALIETLDPLEPAARRRLEAARSKRDDAQRRVDELSPVAESLSVDVVERWDELSPAERRDVIRATGIRAVVGPGRGASRISPSFK